MKSGFASGGIMELFRCEQGRISALSGIFQPSSDLQNSPETRKGGCVTFFPGKKGGQGRFDVAPSRCSGLIGGRFYVAAAKTASMSLRCRGLIGGQGRFDVALLRCRGLIGGQGRFDVAPLRCRGLIGGRCSELKTARFPAARNFLSDFLCPKLALQLNKCYI